MGDVIVRQVMIRPGWSVEAIPAVTLREVFGEVTPDPRIQFIVLSFEYWLRSSATPGRQRREMLNLLPHSLTEHNAYRLVSLLAKRGVAADFFDLASPSIDRDGAFRQVLLANGILIDTIRYYANWNGINPREFLNGFLFGMVESASSVVVDLVNLGKLILRAWEWQLRGMFLLATDRSAALDDFWRQVTLVGQVFDGLMAQLDPSKLPAALVNMWGKWNAEFERHLKNLDAFAAGRVLGEIGGDLWQMLTGIIALIALLRVAGRAVFQYTSLLLGRARAIAAESAIVLADLVRVLRTLGRGLLDELPRIGLAVLTTLFPPRFLRQLVKDGRALLTYGDLTLFPVFDEGYALAYGGARMRAPFAMVVAERGKPMAMAMTSDRLPPAGGGDLHAQAMASADAQLDRLDDLFREVSRSPKSALNPKVVAAQRLRDIEQRLVTHLKPLLADVTTAAFNDLRKRGRRFTAAELGTDIHGCMKGQVAAFVSKASPGLSLYTERTIRTIYTELAERAAKGGLKQTLAAGGRDALNETVAQFISRRPHLMDVLDIPKIPAARTSQALTTALGKRFGWKPGTTLGDLQCDLVLVETNAGRAVNVDWTSSTKSDRFESTWTKIINDLKEDFSGDPNQIPAAYRKAFGQVPQDVRDNLAYLRRHADRETVIRKAALEEVLGGLWPVASYEMFYTPLDKLWDAVKKLSG